MQIDLQDTHIVVTGAARGIGRTLAIGLATEGARIGVLTRDRARSREVADEIARIPGAPPALALEADVADEAAVARAAAETEEAWGRLDGVVNNAGWMPGRRPVLDLDRDVLDRVLGSNLVGPFLTTKHLAPLMVRSGGGRIVFLSSAAAVQSGPGGAPYGASKAALEILSNVVHQELGGDGVRTTAIAPGLTVTPGMREVVGPEHLEHVSSRYPGGRVGRPEDLVALVAFLCSPLAEHLSGTTIMVRPPANR